MSSFHKLKIVKVERNTSDCVLLSFEVPDNLKSAYTFIQGQYLTLETSIAGEKVRRSYSLCSSPKDNNLRVGVKKIPGGKFSSYANEELKAGDSMDVMQPAGNFYVKVDDKSKRNYVAFAAGSGITPIFSIIKTHLESEPKASFKLFFVNQTVASIMLKEELEALKNTYLDRFEIFYFLTRQNRGIELFNGRLDNDKLTLIFNSICNVNEIDYFFSCGPEEMVFMIEAFLVQKGVQKDKLKFELFGTGAGSKKDKTIAVADNGKMCSVTLIEGGKSMNFKLAQGGNNILDAALNNAADLPYACKGGVCSTCKAKLIEGKVEMEVSYGLEQDEIDAGYILTCQALPITDKIVVDFDT